MDIVVTTPHGDADIDIVAAPQETTLADLLRRVTGQAPPTIARLDGRAVSTARLLTDIELAIGSTIDTRPEHVSDGDAAGDAVGDADEVDGPRGLVEVVQLTGRGAGTARMLPPGRFVVGIAQSLRGDELGSGPVDTAAVEVAVDPDGGVRVSPTIHIARARGADAPTLGGRLLDRELPWIDGQLHIGGRRFELHRPPTPPERPRRSTPLADGSVPFRRGSEAPSTPRRLVVGAVRDAATRAGQLWQWRPGDRSAYEIGFGLHRDGSTVASIDLLRHTGAAVVGSERFTSALARTLIVEVCTMHGPSTLDLVIASTPEHAGRWNWARWLPHLRAGSPTAAPRLVTDPQRLAEWVDSIARGSISPSLIAPTLNPSALTASTPRLSTPKRLTILVVDDVSLWSQRVSPLQNLLADFPDDLRLVALCDTLDDAPPLCSERLVEVSPSQRATSWRSDDRDGPPAVPELFGSLVTHHSFDADAHLVTGDISPALVEERVAARVARQLAPLDDLDRRRAGDVDGTVDPAAPTVSELVEASAARAGDGSRLAVVVGSTEVVGSVPSTRRDLSVELTGSLSTIMTAAGAEQHELAVAAVVLGAAAQRRPDELAIVILARDRRSWYDQLPHVVGHVDRSEASDPARLLHRIAHVVSERPELHVLIVVEHAFDSDRLPLPELVTAMNELTVTHHNVHVVWSGDHPGSVPSYARSSCGALVWITPGGGGTVWFPDRSFSFTGPATAADDLIRPDAGELVVRPSAVGRSLTTLERRLERMGESPNSPIDLTLGALARRIGERYGGSDSPGRVAPTLFPPPLPTSVEATALLAENPGDAIPIGLVDRPEHARHDPYWWQPGRDGSVLAVGAPRSAMTSLIDVIALGIAARFAADDLHVYAIEHSGPRRRMIESLPHTGDVADPDRSDEIVGLIAELRSGLADRLRRPTDVDRPDIVLLISDLGGMRRSLAPEQIETTLEQLGELVASGAWVGVNVVIGASGVDDLGPLDRLTGNRLVGPMSDPDDRSRLGVSTVDAADRHPRRCWSTAVDRRVQLATPPDDIETRIAALAPEPPRYRPPIPILTRDDA